MGLYRELTHGPRGQAGDVPVIDDDGALLGPFAVMALSPTLGEAVQSVGASLRYRSSLEPYVREAAVLLVAAHYGSAFEWSAHEGPARRVGWGEADLAAFRAGEVPRGASTSTRTALGAVQQLLVAGTLDDTTYGQTSEALGQRGLAELVWLVGYYAMLALALAVFEPDDPDRNRGGPT